MLLNLFFIDIQSQNFDWAKREGLWAYDYGYGITTDNTGNVYVAGKYELNSNFSNTILPDQGNHDIYIAQYSSTGALNWIKTAGGALGDYAHAIACDGTSSVYMAGEIEGEAMPITFVGTTTTLNCVGDNDIFLAKYDLSGNLQWAKQAGWWHSEKALGITYDPTGNVYICGYFSDTTYFETNMILGYGEKDIFVAKYDMNGNFLWVRKAGSAGRDEAKSIQCDAAGNVYVCGMYSNGAVFGTQTLISPNGYFNAFLAKYAPDGTLTWVKTAGGDYDEVAWSLVLDNAGKVYITGEYNASADFDGTQLITSGNADIFVACYDAAGTMQWVKSAGGALIDRARGIGCDGSNVYITGQFGGTATFGTSTVTAADSSDIFMAKLNNVGTFTWATSVGGVADSVETLGYESGNTICAEASGNVYATGSLLDGGVFGSTSYDEYGRTDIFMAKITQGPDVTAPSTVSYNPIDNSIDVPMTSNLVITFNETVQKGAGNIIIKEAGIVSQTIDVSTANVTIAGNIVTINPTTNFTLSSLVNVEISAGTFKDMANNNYTGITDVTAWNFTVSASSTTSIKETDTQKKLSIYPNPNGGNFILDLTSLADQKIEMTILNYLGQLIDSRTHLSPSKLNVELPNNEKGIYFIEIRTDQKVFREKIIVQ